jgi:D-3-phosphoglycerate dehydrogenase
VPDYSTTEVSDHAVALSQFSPSHIHISYTTRTDNFIIIVFAFHRNVVKNVRHYGEWGWDPLKTVGMRRTSTQIVGILGYGMIGRLAGDKLRALGFQVIAYDPAHKPGSSPEIVDLDTLLARSDYISLHVPFLPSTHHLVNAEFLKKTKKGVVIVNTGRGPLVDEQALLAALKSGHVGGAGLDVREQEPPATPDPFVELDNVVLTPHIAYASIESRAELKTRLSEEIVAALKGEKRELGPHKGRA